MTQKEAENKARELWGENAFAKNIGPNLYAVGERNGFFKQEYGVGKNWLDAFNQAKLNLN